MTFGLSFIGFLFFGIFGMLLIMLGYTIYSGIKMAIDEIKQEKSE